MSVSSSESEDDTPQSKYNSFSFPIIYPFTNTVSKYRPPIIATCLFFLSFGLIPIPFYIGYVCRVGEGAARGYPCPSFRQTKRIFVEGTWATLVFTPVIIGTVGSTAALYYIHPILSVIGLLISTYILFPLFIVYSVHRDAIELYTGTRTQKYLSSRQYLKSYLQFLVLYVPLVLLFASMSIILIGLLLTPLVILLPPSFFGYKYRRYHMKVNTSLE